MRREKIPSSTSILPGIAILTTLAQTRRITPRAVQVRLAALRRDLPSRVRRGFYKTLIHRCSEVHWIRGVTDTH